MRPPKTPEPLTPEQVWELLFQQDVRWGYLKAWATAEPDTISRETLLDMMWGLEATCFEERPDDGRLLEQSAQHSQQ